MNTNRSTKMSPAVFCMIACVLCCGLGCIVSQICPSNDGSSMCKGLSSLNSVCCIICLIVVILKMFNVF